MSTKTTAADYATSANGTQPVGQSRSNLSTSATRILSANELTPELLKEARRLAARYLREHDDQVITKDWLMSVGFISHSGIAGDDFRLAHQGPDVFGVHLCFGAPISVNDPPIRCWLQSVEPEAYTRTVKNITLRCINTRADVRRLCTALGIELREPQCT